MPIADAPHTSESMPQLPAYILAGGQNRRFGEDKARVEIENEPLIVRLLTQLSRLGHATHIVADQPRKFADLDLSNLVDAAPRCGPIGGLLTALRHRERSYGPGWFLLVACDQVLWRAAWSQAWVESLPPRASRVGAIHFITAAEGSVKASAALEPSELQPEWILQPIPAAYHTNIAALLDSSDSPLLRSPRRLLEMVSTVQLVAEEESSLLGDLDVYNPPNRPASANRAPSPQPMLANARLSSIHICDTDNPAAWTFNSPEQFHALKRRLGAG